MATPPASSLHLVLVRHAESLHNRDGAAAPVDSGLTALGWRQAHAVAAWLQARYRPDVVLSSSLIRAQQTAEVIGAAFEMPVQTVKGLEEAELPYWEELPYSWQAPMDSWDDNWQPDPAAAPRYVAFRDALHDGLLRVLDGRQNSTILAVTHGGAIGTLMRSLFGGHHVAVNTANTGITQFTWEKNHWRLVFHNATAHLDALAAPRANSVAAASVPNNHHPPAIIRHLGHVAAALPVTLPAGHDRLVAELVDFSAPLETDRVLDLATGAGAVALAFAPHVREVVSLDLSPAMLEQAERSRSENNVVNVHFRIGDIGRAPLGEGAFSLAVCHNLLHHVQDLPALLARLRSLLASDGRLVFDELVGSDDPVKRATLNAILVRRDAGVTQVLSQAELLDALARAGFRLRRVERYAWRQAVDEWLALASADEATRGAVTAMIEAGMDADAAALEARTNRDGALTFAESRIRILADRPPPTS